MMKRKAAAVAIALTAAANAGAAERIDGRWRTASGEIASIASCSGGYCITAETGPNKGKRIGQFSATADGYAGELSDPSNGRTYSGTGRLEGATLKLRGCALKIFCRSQTWTRP